MHELRPELGWYCPDAQLMHELWPVQELGWYFPEPQ